MEYRPYNSFLINNPISSPKGSEEMTKIINFYKEWHNYNSECSDISIVIEMLNSSCGIDEWVKIARKNNYKFNKEK